MLDIQKYIGSPKIITTAIDDLTMKFDLQYVPRGFGHTLGNALRRAILGYNIGGAITAMKMK
ncbi:hypothetical protein KA478_00225 [Patescibacteria group bacterium]|nr:hypothetical protein [Patescibacteria group bacterium]